MAEAMGAPVTGPYSIPLGDKPYSSPYTSIGQEVCENLFVEHAITETSVAPYYYVSAPGMKAIINRSAVNTSACRGLYSAGTGKVFGVWSNKLYSISSGALSRTIIGTLSTFSGPVRFADNGTDMVLVDGKNGYVVTLNSNAFATITDDYFPGVDIDTEAPTHIACIDQYFLVNRQNSNQYFWSNLNYTTIDGHQWNGLQFGRKVGDSDDILAMCKTVGLLWLFGRQSIEVHYDTGDYNEQLFARVQNALINFGCHAKNGVSGYANNVYWLGADKSGTIGIFTASTDFMPTRISTRGVESYIQSMLYYDDAISFTYAADGHAFVCWYFPEGKQTWCYDVVTQSWHRRTYYDYQTGTTAPWRAIYSTYGFGYNLVGDRLNDALYSLDSDYFQNDNGDGSTVNYIQRIKTTPITLNMGKFARYKEFQLLMQQGTGLTVDTAQDVGSTPKAMISWSNDSGRSWSNERTVEIGKIGEYSKRTRLTMLGIARNRVWKVRITDPVRVVIAGLLVNYDSLNR